MSNFLTSRIKLFNKSNSMQIETQNIPKSDMGHGTIMLFDLKKSGFQTNTPSLSGCSIVQVFLHLFHIGNKTELRGRI